jgi:aminodeoxyfutalosine deaminase
LIYRGRYLVTMNGPPIPWGGLRIVGDRVTQVGTLESLIPLPGEAIRDFPDAVLMPGLINAHCHLELGLTRGILPRDESFSVWVSRLRKALDGAKPEQYQQAARLGILECLKNGTTTVVDVGNTGQAMSELAALPIRSFPYLEVIGLNPGIAEERLQQSSDLLERAKAQAAGERFHPDLTCHAPYSCSIELMRSISGSRMQGRLPYTLHVAESLDEMLMFKEGRGPLYDFCSRIYPALNLGTSTTPIQFLYQHGLIPKGSLFAHCNYTDTEDIRILAETETSVVHCPRSKAFFGHAGFSLESFRQAGINICLGTDSLASNEGLNLFDEMAELNRNYPSLPCEEILAMATVNGARALGSLGELGCIMPGSFADFIALSLRHHPECDLYEEIVSEDHEVLLVCVAGEEIVS